MVKENIFQKIKMFIMEDLKMIKLKAKEYISFMMEEYNKVIIKMDIQ